MLSKNEAVAIAEKALAPDKVGTRYEDETTYYFYAEGEITGGFIVTVNKHDGTIDWLTIPPLENLDRIKKAKPF